MNKILGPLLMAVLCLSLAACSASGPTQVDGSTSIPSVSQSTDNASPSESPQNEKNATTSEMEENKNHVSESEEEEASQTSESNPTQTSSTPTTEVSGSTLSEKSECNVLVAYFSWADNAVLDDNVDAVSSPSVIAPGNVQQLAGWVQEETGGDLFSIQVAEPYPSDWDECLDRANEERGSNVRPTLTGQVENLDQYDTVFLGYPNWWYGVPMALRTFLEENDLSGKEVYLFCSHGTGGLARSVQIITEAAPDAIISENIFDCYEEEASTAQADIQSWVSELGY